jgi:hypothetical protein
MDNFPYKNFYFFTVSWKKRNIRLCKSETVKETFIKNMCHGYVHISYAMPFYLLFTIVQMDLINMRNTTALTIYWCLSSSVKEKPVMSNIGKSTNILWHNCPIGQSDRQKLLGQKGCVVWITGLSGSGMYSVDCCLGLFAGYSPFFFNPWSCTQVLWGISYSFYQTKASRCYCCHKFSVQFGRLLYARMQDFIFLEHAGDISLRR